MRGRKERHRGYTLVEVLAVVAIIAIVTAIALPRYGQYTTRVWRARAAGCLTELALAMERRFTIEMSYEGDLPDRACSRDAGLVDRYEFVLVEAEQAEFLIEARPIGTQATRDAACAPIGVDNAGGRLAGPEGDSPDCW